MGVTPNTFLNILLQTNSKEKSSLLTMDEMPLPPTYMPPESTPAQDATFYYIVGGMTLLMAAFGNFIVLNFVSFLASSQWCVFNGLLTSD